MRRLIRRCPAVLNRPPSRSRTSEEHRDRAQRKGGNRYRPAALSPDELRTDESRHTDEQGDTKRHHHRGDGPIHAAALRRAVVEERGEPETAATAPRITVRTNAMTETAMSPPETRGFGGHIAG